LLARLKVANQPDLPLFAPRQTSVEPQAAEFLE
jgi:hypothetical protein